MSLRSRQSLLGSMGLSLAATVWTTLLALVTVPIMVNGLGLVSYGIYSVAFSVAALGSYLDLGLGWTTSKFVAEADAVASRRQIGTAIAASALFHLITGLLFAAAVLSSAGWISVTVLRIPQDQAGLTITVLRITALSFVASSLTGVFLSALRGMRWFAAAMLIATGATTLSVAGAAAAAWLGLGVVIAAVAQLVGAACGLMAGLGACFGLLRASDRGEVLWRQLRAMLSFSIWNYIARLSQMMVLHADKIAMARWAGPAALPFYVVPFNLSQRISFLAQSAVTTIYPMAAVGRFDREVFMRQYLAASRLVHIVTAALAIAILVWADRFLDAWVGPEMAGHGTFFLRVLTVGFWIVSVATVDSGCIEGWNRPKVGFAMSVIALVTGLAVAAATWVQMGPAKAIALGVASYFVMAGIGTAAIWYSMSRYSARFMLWRIALPVAEMGLLAMAASTMLRPVVETRIAVISILPILFIVLAAYGILRAFSGNELRSLAGRVLASLRAA